jgi:hypothetical protein
MSSAIATAIEIEDLANDSIIETDVGINLSSLVLTQLTAAFRTLILQGTDKICSNFDNLSAMSPNDRQTEIYKLFGMSNDEIIKIKGNTKKNPKSETDKTTNKPRGKRVVNKPFPLPFHKSLIDNSKCHGLATKALTQCPNNPVEGSVYCAKCKKQADEVDENVPKMGTIETRIEQQTKPLTVNGKQLSKWYQYLSPYPDSKPKNIYYPSVLEKSGNTIQEAFSKLSELGIDVDVKVSKNSDGSSITLADILSYAPPKKIKVSRPKADRKSKKNSRPGDEDTDSEADASETEYEDDDDDDKVGKYIIGQKVIYEYDGEEYICEIIDVNGNRYDITSDDITFENVPENKLRNVPTPAKKSVKEPVKAKAQEPVKEPVKELVKKPVKAKEPEPEPEPVKKPVKSPAKTPEPEPKPTKSKYRQIAAKHPENIQVAAIRSESNNVNLAEFELYEIMSGTEEGNNIIVSENPIGKFVRGKNGKAGKCEWYEPEEDDVPYADDEEES